MDHHKGFTGMIEVALCQAVHLPRNQVADILIRICRRPQRKLALDSLKIVFTFCCKSTKNIQQCFRSTRTKYEGISTMLERYLEQSRNGTHGFHLLQHSTNTQQPCKEEIKGWKLLSFQGPAKTLRICWAIREVWIHFKSQYFPHYIKQETC